ncbi:MAG TPA: energy transducer TonB [Thermoanaerobaculia bacterium]|jgi:protein TonB
MLLIGKTAARIRPRDDPGPRYTEEARKSRIQGMVILRTVIDEEGNVAAAEVVKGLPFGLTESALETIRTWRYQPAVKGNRPVPVYLNVLVNFRLM